MEMAKKIGLWQISAILFVALTAYFLAGSHGAFSALAGGFAVWAGTQLAALSMRKKGGANAGGALLVLLRAEAIKIVVIALLLLLIFKLYAAHVVPAALIAGLAVAALLSGLGIMRANGLE